MQRNYNLDLLKFFSVFFIILMHVNIPFFYNQNSYSIGHQVINFNLYFTRFAVSTFFAISGYLYANSSNKAKNIATNTIDLLFVYMILFIFINIFNQLNIVHLDFKSVDVPLWFFFSLLAIKVFTLFENKFYLSILFIIGLFALVTSPHNNFLNFLPIFILSMQFKKFNYTNSLIGFLIICSSLILISFNVITWHYTSNVLIIQISGFLLFLGFLILPPIDYPFKTFIANFTINSFYYQYCIIQIARPLFGHTHFWMLPAQYIFVISILMILTFKFKVINYFKFKNLLLKN